LQQLNSSQDQKDQKDLLASKEYQATSAQPVMKDPQDRKAMQDRKASQVKTAPMELTDQTAR